MLGVAAMNSTIFMVVTIALIWRLTSKRYHATGLATALKRTALDDVAPATVFESLFRHHDALLRRGCSSAEIHALVIQSFRPSERHHLHYIRRFGNVARVQGADVIDAGTLCDYIDAMRQFKERSYPHICGRERRHPRPRMLSVPRI
jgi:hypothetical protein